jgi:hypothetical protein
MTSQASPAIRPVTTDRITILVPEGGAEPSWGVSHDWTPPVELHGYREFAESLEQVGAGRVEISDLGQPLPQGLLLLDAGGLDQLLAKAEGSGSSVLPRVFLLNANRLNVLNLLESYNLAGAIEQNRYFQWRHNPNSDRGSGIYGLKELAASMGSESASAGPFASERYCVFYDARPGGLPQALIDYWGLYAGTIEHEAPHGLFGKIRHVAHEVTLAVRAWQRD